MTDVTQILSQIEQGDPSAAEQLLPLLPFLAAMIFVLLIVTFWAPLTTWLPGVLM